MCDQRTTCKVGDIAARTRNALVGGPFGSNLVSTDYVASGVPVIRGENMGKGRWVGGTFAYVTAEKAESLSSNLARPGDLVFTQRGTLGQIAIVPAVGPELYLLSQSQMKLTPDPAKADVLFLYYAFISPEQQGHIRRNAIQTGVPHTNLGILRDTPLTLPSVEDQRAIAKILGTFDDKIELNQRINETLEAIARAIFKSWFVDFDPVNAKVEGRPPEGFSTGVAAMFPAAFEVSSIGRIPSGWSVRAIGDLVKVVGGSTPRTEEPSYWAEGKIAWATPKDLAQLSTPVLLDTGRHITEAGLAQISSGLLPKGSLLLSSRAPIGYLAIAEVPVAINQGFIGMLCDSELPLPNLYVLEWIRANMDVVKGRANGTTFLEISKADFRPIEVVAPSREVLDVYMRVVQPLYDRLVANVQESQTLAALRDSLLPKLMSGAVRVQNAEELVEVHA